MAEYFKSFTTHVHGEVNLDARMVHNQRINGAFIASIGNDDIISIRNIQTNQQKNIELPPDNGFSCITLSPKTGKFVVGGYSKTAVEMDMDQTEADTSNIIYEALGNIFEVKYSHSGKFLSIASQEQKCMVIDTVSKTKYKCRPGHNSKIFNTFFSPDDKFVASIGEDCFCLIYELNDNKDPQEVFRQKIFCDSLQPSVSGCFHFTETNKKAFIPGGLQILEILFLNNHWEMHKTKMAHSSPIICCESVSNNCIVTSCNRDLCIWGAQAMEKLIVLEDYPMNKILSFNGGFIGVRNDGNIYVYNRPLPNSFNTQMDIQENEDRIVFDVEQKGYDEPLDLNDDAEQYRQTPVIKYISSKKTKADKVIQVFPQMSLTSSTQFFDSKRFLYVNMHGCLIENRQNDDDTLVQVEFHQHENPDKIQTKTIFRNKDYTKFAMNEQAVLYASETQFGLFVDQFSSWSKNWVQISHVTLSSNWLAVANPSQIRMYDISGNHIKSISFNRYIVSMVCYENLLAVVYHESIPMWNKQMLSMEIFSVTKNNSVSVSSNHVPITEGSILRWLDFSKQGMIFSQDSYGFLRAYSLEANEWTGIYSPNLAQTKRMWIIGVKNYEIYYWKTTEEDPQPTVRPRLNLKSSSLAIATLEQFPQQMQNYSPYLWERFCLDHQLARWRIWGRHKLSRVPNSKNYDLSKNIMNQKQIKIKHQELDNKFSSLVLFLLRSQQHNSGQRAVNLAKSQIRTVEVGRFLIDQFDNVSRNLAIELQEFYDERTHELQYETMLELKLLNLRKQAENSIEPKKNNPMNPRNKRIKEPIPFNFSQSSVSSSIIMQDITHKDQENNKHEEMEIQNPFLKKKSTSNENNARKREIQEQVEKFGIKKKADRKNKL